MWDLPIESMAPGSTIEQIQQLEKAKAMKVRNSFKVKDQNLLTFCGFY